MNLGDLVERNARLFGRRTAFVAEDRKLTHAEFAARAFAFGNALLDRGVGYQSRVAILMRHVWMRLGRTDRSSAELAPCRGRARSHRQGL
jgi:acyl-CoA synthetase (AMP-forming)/AMP-acid ligase II